MLLKYSYLATAAALVVSTAAVAQTTTEPTTTTTTQSTTTTDPMAPQPAPSTTQTTTTQPTTTPEGTPATTTQTTTTQTQPTTTPEGQPATSTTETTTTQTQVTAATADDVKAGVKVFDQTGAEVGKVDSVKGDAAIVNTGKARAEIPLSSFGKNDTGLVISVSKAEIEAKAGDSKKSNR